MRRILLKETPAGNGPGRLWRRPPSRGVWSSHSSMHDTTPRTTAIALALAAALLSAVLAAGCGYHQDVPRLPGGAERIGIGPIRNLTSVGELDVRLRARLKARLLRQAHVRLVSPEAGDLLLTATLTDLHISRVQDSTDPNRRLLDFTLAGRISLADRRSNRMRMDNQPVSAAYQVVIPITTLETPAIRDEGVNGVLSAFAEEVERRLFLSF